MVIFWGDGFVRGCFQSLALSIYAEATEGHGIVTTIVPIWLDHAITGHADHWHVRIRPEINTRGSKFKGTWRPQTGATMVNACLQEKQMLRMLQMPEIMPCCK